MARGTEENRNVLRAANRYEFPGLAVREIVGGASGLHEQVLGPREEAWLPGPGLQLEIPGCRRGSLTAPRRHGYRGAIAIGPIPRRLEHRGGAHGMPDESHPRHVHAGLGPEYRVGGIDRTDVVPGLVRRRIAPVTRQIHQDRHVARVRHRVSVAEHHLPR
jgi:hypothetical protein